MIKFAIVSAWPELKNAEYEIIERIKISSKNNNAECIVVDNEGYIIDKNDKRTDQHLECGEVEFVIALHFISEKLYNCYMYGAMWNPPKFLADWGYDQESNKYYTYDDYLIYGSRKIDGHLKNLLLQTNKDISECLHFMTSVPGNPLTPKITDQAKLFYSGINWERISNSKGRHHDLFKALDNENLTRIYGPEKFFDAVPWKGFQTYSGSLPFDGLSAMKAINECGISLVLTSDVHRDAEAVSSRLFESAAAGAVLICDNNPYIVREFGDSVLYINYDKTNYAKNVEQIKKHLEWIKDNQIEAIDLAKRSQNIYIQKFHLDNVLANIIEKHPVRKAQVIEQNCDVNTGVSVILRIIKNNEYELESFIKSINTQYNKTSIDLIVVCDNAEEKVISDVLCKNLSSLIQFTILGMQIFKNEHRIVTTGELLVYGLKHAKFDYVSIVDLGRMLFEDHLSLCLKQFEDPNISLVYTGTCANDLQKNGELKRYKLFFGNYFLSEIANFIINVDISSLIIKKNSLTKYYNHLSMLDGFEVYSIMLATFLVGDWKFTYKITLSQQITDSKDSLQEVIIDNDWQEKMVSDAFKYNQKIANITQKNTSYIDISLIDMSQFEILLKRFLKSKIEKKYPKLLITIKKIYNKVFKL